ncbi:hypothetical protein FisN_17Hh244 [Fistulifera solaris]|uniref:Uncharacterized protein n=1 Tax=Fistulifera solaris TaxID=1519565 RepID=A0A1Z5JH25_FISSO|nr:hypothetical protein FisN_17Hh244 [Fistulifera solaris]|eukprot:GAX13303.1 hypothetical protein FisN_17Hh244 [Fistulifera solaris]
MNCTKLNSRNGGYIRKFAVLLLLLISTTTLPTAVAVEAKWTPNDESSQPLPQSMKQREQLLELENAIRSSPNPEETLVRVAEANQMEPKDLWDLLSRNRQDLEAAGVLTGNSTGGRRNLIWKVVSSVVAVTVNSARKNPRSFLLTVTALSFIVFAAISAPRTGLVISNQRHLLSRGPTTMWKPPTAYIHAFLESRSGLSVKASNVFPDLSQVLDGTTDPVWHKFTKAETSDLRHVACVQSVIDPSDFVESDGEDEDDDDIAEYVMELLMDHASQTMTSLELTEFVEPEGSLRNVVAPGRKKTALIVSRLGDWGRFGLQPLLVTHMESSTNEEEQEEEMELTLGTMKGGHFDGYIQIGVRLKDSTLTLQTAMYFPKSGKALSQSVALRIVEQLNASLEKSMRTRTKQSLARRSQSSNLSGSARRQALKRRHSRFAKEQAMEEMAAERRRRWQRSNPNSGSYRPSGDRMRSPNNAIYK